MTARFFPSKPMETTAGTTAENVFNPLDEIRRIRRLLDEELVTKASEVVLTSPETIPTPSGSDSRNDRDEKPASKSNRYRFLEEEPVLLPSENSESMPSLPETDFERKAVPVPKPVSYPQRIEPVAVSAFEHEIFRKLVIPHSLPSQEKTTNSLMDLPVSVEEKSPTDEIVAANDDTTAPILGYRLDRRHLARVRPFRPRMAKRKPAPLPVPAQAPEAPIAVATKEKTSWIDQLGVITFMLGWVGLSAGIVFLVRGVLETEPILWDAGVRIGAACAVIVLLRPLAQWFVPAFPKKA